jgi:hypothetical protein
VAEHTYGWGKTMAPISRQRFVDWTGYGLGTVNRALAKLRKWNMILSRRGQPNDWGIQKDYDAWTKHLSNKGDKESVQHSGHHIGSKQEAGRTDEPEGSSGEVAQAILKLVVEHGLHGEWPPDCAKQYKIAEYMVEKEGVTEEVALRGCRGMRRLFAFSRGQPFGMVIFKARLSEALAAVKNERDTRQLTEERAAQREKDAEARRAEMDAIAKRNQRPLTPEKREAIRKEAEKRGLNLGKMLDGP